MFGKCLATWLGILSFSLAIESRSGAIYIDEDETIILIDGECGTELENFTEGNIEFNWSHYEDRRCEVIVKNASIASNSSADFLVWLQKKEFHVFLESSNFIGFAALNRFSKLVKKRTHDSFANVIFRMPFPLDYDVTWEFANYVANRLNDLGYRFPINL